MPIVQTLATKRRELGLSQEAVARRAGLKQTYLSKIEHAKVDPRVSTLQDIARAEGLELLVVPAELVPAIHAMIGNDRNPEERPLFEADAE